MTETASSPAPNCKSPGLRLHLVAIVVATLLPALVVGTVAVWVAVDGYRATYEDGLNDTARALSLAIDSEVDTFRSAMLTLAGSSALDGPVPNLAAFEREARRAATALGSSVALIDPTSLRQVINTALPPGEQAQSPANEVFRKVRETGRPLVTDIVLGVVARRAVTGVAVPVERDGRVDYVLSGRLEPSRLSGLLAAQARDGSFATLTDGNNIVIARSRDHDQFVGQIVLPWIVEGTTGKVSGLLRGKNRLGEESISAFRRLSGTPGWFVIVGEPISGYYGAIWRPLAALTLGGLVTIGLALLAAFAIGRRIMRPMRALTRHAEAVVASGGEVAVEVSPPARVAEFERLRQAVDMAEATLRTRADEVTLAEVRLRMAQEAAGVGVFETDLTTGRTHWSAEMFRLYGVDPAEGPPR